MPVRITSFFGPKTLTVDEAKAWVKTAGVTIPDDAATQRILTTFLTQWNKTYGFLQQTEFLRHLSMYVDQVELLNGVGDMCERIVAAYSPRAYMYVGVGRSPAPLIAYLENENLRTLSIPLSDFRPRNQQWSITDDMLGQGQRITPTQRALLFHHFRRYFPVRPARARILLIDYTQSAQSLLAAQEQLQEYFRTDLGEADIEVHALALCRDSDARIARNVAGWIGRPMALRNPLNWYDIYYYGAARQQFAQRWHVMPVCEQGEEVSHRQTLLMAALSRQGFDDLAEYGSFKILSGNAQLVRYTRDETISAAYDALRTELRNAKTI
jgi:hypothetical protein